MRNRITGWAKVVASLGLMGATTYVIAKIYDKFNLSGTILLASRFAKHALRSRCQTSDRPTFRQIFIERQYACLDDLENVGFIVDCGAYVGYSSAYFLNRFPNSHVVAIEPDPENFSVLSNNLAPYKNRVELLQAAVWSHPTFLGFSETKYRDGGAWTTHVRECKLGEAPTITAIDISKILEQSGRQRISILKVDIEGAEGVVFQRGSGFEKWIDRVDTIAIELHDDTEFGTCSDIFLTAISGQGFQISRSGELTICKRPLSGQSLGYQ
jgi:FkbM family methyltransferase